MTTMFWGKHSSWPGPAAWTQGRAKQGKTRHGIRLYFPARSRSSGNALSRKTFHAGAVTGLALNVPNLLARRRLEMELLSSLRVAVVVGGAAFTGLEADRVEQVPFAVICRDNDLSRLELERLALASAAPVAVALHRPVRVLELDQVDQIPGANPDALHAARLHHGSVPVRVARLGVLDDHTLGSHELVPRQVGGEGAGCFQGPLHVCHDGTRAHRPQRELLARQEGHHDI
mmetsp:Transcript_159584/g.488348  ORF Transcript_159584/g.488348 Transcript_159584/m.488348 type:complete len:231 (+) Transcript_159584:220-912(+)